LTAVPFKGLTGKWRDALYSRRDACYEDVYSLGLTRRSTRHTRQYSCELVVVVFRLSVSDIAFCVSTTLEMRSHEILSGNVISWRSSLPRICCQQQRHSCDEWRRSCSIAAEVYVGYRSINRHDRQRCI